MPEESQLYREASVNIAREQQQDLSYIGNRLLEIADLLHKLLDSEAKKVRVLRDIKDTLRKR